MFVIKPAKFFESFNIFFNSRSIAAKVFIQQERSTEYIFQPQVKRIIIFNLQEYTETQIIH